MNTITTYAQAYEANQKARTPIFTRPEFHRNMFGLQIGQAFYGTEHGAFFVTSSRRDRSDKRTYQVRFIDGLTGKVVVLREDYQSNYGAASGAKTLAVAYQHGCTVCRRLGHSPSLPCLD